MKLIFDNQRQAYIKVEGRYLMSDDLRYETTKSKSKAKVYPDDVKMDSLTKLEKSIGYKTGTLVFKIADKVVVDAYRKREALSKIHESQEKFLNDFGWNVANKKALLKNLNRTFGVNSTGMNDMALEDIFIDWEEEL